ncbi:MAG: N-6 DNA methylase [Polaribacter sp.]|jgi:type I restriction enzyme M protein
MTEQKVQLEQQLWNIANTLRGKMDADDFRDYILGFIFYKYLSTKMDLYVNEILEPDNLKFQDLEGHAQEANGSTWALAMMNMFLHGFDNASIRWGDTLRNPKHTEGDNLMKFDTVVANPPFSLDKWGQEEAEEDKYNRFNRGVPPKSKGDWAFISHMIESAYEDTGMVGVVVPHGVLFRGSAEGRIRKRVIEDNLLDAVIGLPANLFFGTGIPAAILIFNKAKDKRTETLFIDASSEYESGKNQNVLSEKHLDHIVETYNKFRENKTKIGVLEEKYSYVSGLT